MSRSARRLRRSWIQPNLATTASDRVRCEADAAGAAATTEVAATAATTGSLWVAAVAALAATAERARIAGAAAFGISAAWVRPVRMSRLHRQRWRWRRRRRCRPGRNLYPP